MAEGNAVEARSEQLWRTTVLAAAGIPGTSAEETPFPAPSPSTCLAIRERYSMKEQNSRSSTLGAGTVRFSSDMISLTSPLVSKVPAQDQPGKTQRNVPRARRELCFTAGVLFHVQMKHTTCTLTSGILTAGLRTSLRPPGANTPLTETMY